MTQGKSGEREKGRKGESGETEKGREAEEEGDKEVKKDVMGWTVVTRNKKQKRRMVQIFVKVNESKTFPPDVSLDDTISDVLRQIQNDEDVYVTIHGRVLKRREKLRSCGVTDGRTIQVTSRMRVGGRHKDKRSKAEKKQATNPERPEQKSDEGPATVDMDEALRRIEENEGYQKIIECVSEGSEGEVEQNVQRYLATIQKLSLAGG